MLANCTKTPENHGGEVFQLEHSFSDLKAAKSHSSEHVEIICQRGPGSACALILQSSRGLAWGCFTAKNKRQSAFWGIRSHRPRLMVE